MNAAAPWVEHSYRSECHGVVGGIGDADVASRSEADAAGGRVHALVSLIPVEFG